MSINIEGLTVEAIEYRPGEGLVVRVAGEPSNEALGKLSDGLAEVLRGSAYAIYRPCCDSVRGREHAEGCEDAPKRGGKST